MTIRQGRILFDQRNLLNDEFASSKALQDWVGLSYDLRDEEAIPALNDAVREEWDTGIGNLPQRQYGWMFADEFVHDVPSPSDKTTPVRIYLTTC